MNARQRPIVERLVADRMGTLVPGNGNCITTVVLRACFGDRVAHPNIYVLADGKVCTGWRLTDAVHAPSLEQH